MCSDIEYQDQKIYFPQPGVRLPVCLREAIDALLTSAGMTDTC